jgi:hypothetical protein
MKHTAGSGLQSVRFDRGALLLIQASPANGAIATATWNVPAGQWWKPLSITTRIDNPAAAGATSVFVTFNIGSTAIAVAALATDLIAATFDGIVSFGINAGQLTRNALPFLASAPLPECWLPPSAFIVISTGAPDSAANMTLPVLITLAADNQPDAMTKA